MDKIKKEISEQIEKEISTYIDNKIEKINKTISDKEKEFDEKLEELKSLESKFDGINKQIKELKDQINLLDSVTIKNMKFRKKFLKGM